MKPPRSSNSRSSEPPKTPDQSSPPISNENQARPSILGRCVVLAIRFYQAAVSPMFGPCCRYSPTCSQYFLLAVQKYGVVRGSVKGVWRILRCHPFSKGGYDPP